MEYAREISSGNAPPAQYEYRIRRNLHAAFNFYIGTLLAAQGQGQRGVEWLEAGVQYEEKGLPSLVLLLEFLKRHGDVMKKPVVVFEETRPFLHFSEVPAMKEVRKQLVYQFGHSLPAFDGAVRFMDIGCGDGSLTANVLTHLLKTGKVNRISEVLLIDASPAMIRMAEETVSNALPGVMISTENSRIQDCSSCISGHYDIAMSSLAYHHMPFEDKRIHLARLKPRVDHFLLFDMEADHDTPEVYSPELALSVYQTYGRMMDFVYSLDAPDDLLTSCIDSFLMTEVISILTEPRGVRTDYHMLRSQWHRLFKSTLGPEFSVFSDSACYADEYLTLFTMHYGRNQ
ncbi:MAG TPA: class I SAM-dependent methyltransferase [Methanoregula sp.]|nr:class I SAM-dependent methyltransferase [Methanoregula sp.]